MTHPALPDPLARPFPAAAPRRLRWPASSLIARAVFCAAAAAATLAPALEAQLPSKGYQARPCGFDMDRDGLFGEPEDCNVCDGATADPDHDGVAEDLIYVDCASGVNSASCGSPTSPCRTIQHAFDARADGPGDGAEDIVCFRGVCGGVENYSLPAGGVPGFYAVPRSGSQSRDWRYPSNPTMLVGWDSDNDGAYPPFDTDDVAVLNGSGRSRTFRLDSDTDYLQMGHFTAREYGRSTSAEDSGFVRFGPRGGPQEYQVFHDLALVNINMERRTLSGTSLINLFPTTAVPQWILFDNLNVTNNGQWFARGAGYESGPDMGPFRFTNITRTSHGCDFSTCGSNAASTAFKIWGYVSRIEILDSVWDANVAAWEPKPNGGPPGTAFVFVDVCSQDWVVRNNAVLDHKTPFRIKGFTQNDCRFPAARPVDDVVFDANFVWNRYEPYTTGDHGVRIEPGGGADGEWTANVSITNNFMGSVTGWEAAVWSYAGHDALTPPGQILIANNTFFGDINRHAAIVLGHIEGSDQNFPHQDYVIENNILAGFRAGSSLDVAIHTTFPATGLQSNYNVIDTAAFFVWNNGADRSLGGWRAISGEDAASRQCLPQFDDATGGDFQLSGGDTCALGRGTPRPTTPAFDFDGDPRPIGTLDIGADEFSPILFEDDFENGLAAWSAASGSR